MIEEQRAWDFQDQYLALRSHTPGGSDPAADSAGTPVFCLPPRRVFKGNVAPLMFSSQTHFIKVSMAHPPLTGC